MREKLRARWKESKLRAWTEGKIHLSRGKKLALNLVLIAVAGLWLWGLAGYPLPTAEMEFRRLERASLEERSELVLSLGKNLEVQAQDGSRHIFVRPMMVGVTDDRVLVGYANRTDHPFDELRCYEREDGPTPVPLHPNFVSWMGVVQEGQEDSFYSTAIPLLLVGVPREAACGEMELKITEWEDGEFHQVAPLFDLGNGIWLAPVEQTEDVFNAAWYRRVDYTLKLYDSAGEPLLEKEGTIPEPL